MQNEDTHLLTKENILKKITGADIFKYYLRPYHRFSDLKAGQNIQNPFLDKLQQTPSFNYYKVNNSDRYRYKDFATTDEGSEFDLVMKLHQCDFYEALRIINRDFNLGLKEKPIPNPSQREGKMEINNTSNYETKPFTPFNKAHSTTNSNSLLNYIGEKDIVQQTDEIKKIHSPILKKDFSEKDLKYFQQYGIEKELLERYNYFATEKYFLFSKKTQKQFETVPTEDNPAFCCKLNEDCYKIYRPFEKNPNHKHLWVNKHYKPDNFKNIFGIEQLPNHCQVILICEGLKDALSVIANLSNKKIYAVALDNAGTKIAPEILALLKSKCRHLFLCLDIDEPGIKATEQLSKQNGLRYVTLPEELKDCGGKDISDYFKFQLPIENLLGLIEQAILQPTPPGTTTTSVTTIATNTTTTPIATPNTIISDKNNLTHIDITHTESELALGSTDEFSDTPYIPAQVYEQLPAILQSSCKAFDTPREKDVFLTGALGVLSGCFPTVNGIYDRKSVKSNLFVFITAPPASGKGVMEWAKHFGLGYHKSLLENNKVQKDNYRFAQLEYEQKKRSGKNKNEELTSEPPDFPPFNILFLPANSSGASFLQHLNENGGKGIIFESEADTLSHAFAQDWGNYSDKLRKAFQHERITHSRKANKEYYEVEYPQLSMVLSGTPAQVQRLIPTTEDGSFSRFIFYSFKIQPKWRDVSPNCQSINLNEYLAEVEKQMLNYILLQLQTETIFELQKHHWEKFNPTFDNWLKEISALISSDAAGVIIRLGLIAYRIAMLLSILRQLESKATNQNIICEDHDFESAMLLAETYKAHALLMFSRMPKETIARQNTNTLNKRKRQLFEALPQEFTREQAVSIANNLSIKTPDRFLMQYCNQGLLTKLEYGVYAKNNGETDKQ